MHWDNRRWDVDESGHVDRLVKETFRNLRHQAAGMEEGDRFAKRLFDHALKYEGNKRIKDVIERMAKEPGICVKPEDFDRDPLLLNVANGTLELKAGKLRHHGRGDLITKISPVRYDAAATCPTWLSFLDRIFAGNKNLIRFIHTLTGLNRERALFILHGGGANGKSTLLAVLRYLLGEYATQTAADTLMAKKHEGIPNDIPRLRGARFVAATETDAGKRLAEGLIKRITGGEDMLTARFLRAEYFEFVPEFKLFFATNHKPEIRGADDAIWERVRLIPFNVTIPADERDGTLIEKLKTELPGILTWAVAGCVEWQREGLGTPPEVHAATCEYREEMDPLAEFISACCVTGDRCQAHATPLYESYKGWCSGTGEIPVSQTRFGRQLGERGFKSSEDGRGRKLRVGIGLRGPDSRDSC